MQMLIEHWIASNKQNFGSEYEELFARNVLSIIKGLNPSNITVQYPFTDNDGKSRYCDFVIIESDTVRFAIEIDGYDKRGSGTGMSREDFIDWQRRQASLASQGWHVLRFANNDVRDFPDFCAAHIMTLLEKLRSTESGKTQIISIASATYGKEIKKVAERFFVIENVSSKQTSNGFWFWFISIAIAIAVITLFFVTKKDVPVQLTTQTQSALTKDSIYGDVPQEIDGDLFTEGKLNCKNPIRWSEAKSFIGRDIYLIGPLLDTKFKPNVVGQPTYIDVGAEYPNPNRLQLIVWGANRGNVTVRNFKPGWREVEGEVIPYYPPDVCVKGTVSMYKGVPQIEVSTDHQIMVYTFLD